MIVVDELEADLNKLNVEFALAGENIRFQMGKSLIQ